MASARWRIEAPPETECPILLQHGILHSFSEIARGHVRQIQFSYHSECQNQGKFRTLKQYRAYRCLEHGGTHCRNTWHKVAITCSAAVFAALIVAGNLDPALSQTGQGFVVPDTAQDAIRKGREAFQREDYPAALEWFRKGADAGNAEAQTWLGTLYLNGWGVTKDYAEALALFQKAAAQGYALAQIKIGTMYKKGVGVPQDDAQAVIWMRKAADSGDASAQNYIGLMYALGEGVPKDEAKAVGWLRKSADQGNAEGQANLAWMYRWGLGVPKNEKLALALYRKAAAQGNEDAKKQLPAVQQAVHSASAEKINAKIPTAVRIRCLFDPMKDTGDPAIWDRRVQDCLRTNWKKLYPSEPFPLD